MKRILIIGATSAIAEATARIWAKSGDKLFLIGRDKGRLDVIAEDLKIRGAAQVFVGCIDINNYERHLPIITEAIESLGGLDIAFIAHGTLSNQEECEESVDLALREIKTNALSVVSSLTYLANYFELQRAGTIAVISSVAGDRGRQSNYVYGSAKALVTTFTSGLRQRLYKSGVSVVTIKPGFVDTPMTAEFKKGPLWASPEKVGSIIVSACEGGKGEIYAPSFWWLIMSVIKSIPEAIFVRLKL